MYDFRVFHNVEVEIDRRVGRMEWKKEEKKRKLENGHFDIHKTFLV